MNGRDAQESPSHGRSLELEQAYRFCRRIAKREAKNFYYAFRVLPVAKRDAMCAVYAFMRRADDLADDEAMTLAARRNAMTDWLRAWRLARAGSTADPVFLALNDVQRRFGVSDALLEELVSGTAMDLEPQPAGTALVDLPGGAQPLQVYVSFASLYRYCYLVASVVGLVCIRIFGYTDPAAEELAEETGIAFQLTNILRDVREDAERGRIYLPMDDMATAGATFEDVLRAADAGAVAVPLRALLAQEGTRAEQYYGAADRLLPLIDPDARAALWVMVTIYHDLLRAIQALDYDVFSRRVRVSTPAKLAVLARGFLLARRLGKAT